MDTEGPETVQRRSLLRCWFQGRRSLGDPPVEDPPVFCVKSSKVYRERGVVSGHQCPKAERRPTSWNVASGKSTLLLNMAIDIVDLP